MKKPVLSDSYIRPKWPRNYHYRLSKPIDDYALCATCGHRYIDHDRDIGCNWGDGRHLCNCDGFKQEKNNAGRV